MNRDIDAIVNFRRLDERITTSGRVTESDLQMLSSAGVEAIVDLAPSTRPGALADEARLVTELGMDYVHIPVDFDAPREEDFGRFVAAMEAFEDRRIHIHCILNARVTAFVYRWTRDVVGHGEPGARAMMESIWKPGGEWARFIGDLDAVDLPHRADWAGE